MSEHRKRKAANRAETSIVRWEAVASSTSNGTHGERDYLVKEVLPDLHEWCEEGVLR